MTKKQNNFFNGFKVFLIMPRSNNNKIPKNKISQLTLDESQQNSKKKSD